MGKFKKISVFTVKTGQINISGAENISRFVFSKTPLMITQVLFNLVTIILTIGLLLLSVLIVLRYYFSHVKQPVDLSAHKADEKIILPLRLQAYERIVLFLERITPNNLVMRINRPEMDAFQLQNELLRAIREEFEYNLSQQLYISSRSWELVKNAKEEMIRMINLAAGQVNETSPSGELARVILELYIGNDSPLRVESALEAVKGEIQKDF